MTTIVLVPPKFSSAQRAVHMREFRRAGVPTQSLRWQRLTHGMSVSDKRRGPGATRAKAECKEQFNSALARLNPSLIVINDPTALEFISGRRSLYLCRGSNFDFGGTPALVFADTLTLIRAKTNYAFHWAWQQDAQKFNRFLTGQRRTQPAFSYHVCRTLGQVVEAARACERSLFVSVDIETNGAGRDAHITCVQYGAWSHTGELHCFVIPIYSGAEHSNRFWESPELEARVRHTIGRINKSNVRKVLQNGAYDAHYFIRERMPLVNWWMDTAVAGHSIHSEAPKRLDWLASIYLDNVAYWKDESKDLESATDDSKAGDLPTDQAGMERFGRYGAQDVYYTACLVPPLFSFIRANSYAAQNYRKSIYQFTGPSLEMSLRGVAVDQGYQTQLSFNSFEKAEHALNRLQTITSNPDYNPDSWQQNAKLVYDTLGSRELPRKGRSTSEKVFEMIQTQGVLQRILIDLIFEFKKERKKAAEFGPGLRLFNGRVLYGHSPIGTETCRYNARASAFHCGRNIQNIHKDGNIREMFVADNGMVLFDIDYAASDKYFTFYSADEVNGIENLEGPRDIHCVHAAEFFKQPYEKIFEGYKEKSEEVVHSTRGVRQLSKRLGYGTDYGMEAYGVFIQMGREAVEAAARHLGYQNAKWLSIDQLVAICSGLQSVYYERIYPGLKPWIRDEKLKVKNNGNLATSIGGITRRFFGPIKNSDVERELQAFYGQTGTAANINRAIENIWYSEKGKQWRQAGGQLLFQVHDSIVGQVPENRLDLVGDCCQMMEQESISFNGKRFTVPVEAAVGRRWGSSSMVDYPADLQTIDAKEKQWQQEWNQ